RGDDGPRDAAPRGLLPRARDPLLRLRRRAALVPLREPPRPALAATDREGHRGLPPDTRRPPLHWTLRRVGRLLRALRPTDRPGDLMMLGIFGATARLPLLGAVVTAIALAGCGDLDDDARR